MIGSRSWTFGNTQEFAISISFENDPDQGECASPDYSASWGSLQIWVNGLNLCHHIENNVTLDKVHWYLLPMLRWFVTNWDFLLHEERLPNKNVGRDAWVALQDTIDAPPSLSEADAEEWEDQYQQWWSRHCLLACREGGLFPNIVIRRYRDSVEFSWGPANLAGKPNHYAFLVNHGYARINIKSVAEQLEEILNASIGFLCSEMPESAQFTQLLADFKKIRDNRRLKRRLSIIAGLHHHNDSTEQVYAKLIRDFSKTDDNARWDFFKGDYTNSYVKEAPQVCMMFGCIAPYVTKNDVQNIASLVASLRTTKPESPLLKQHTVSVPLKSALERPWDMGYEMARQTHENLDRNFLETGVVGIEKLVDELGIVIKEITLQDRTIRAIALAGEYCVPSIAINSNYIYPEVYPRRFTLAHELCHLLFDRLHGIRIAMASGPWAPIDVEKRANAFAAMFLMPPELICSIVDKNKLRLDNVSDIRKLSDGLQVSFSAAIEHLCNLGFIDETIRDTIKTQVIENSLQ